MNRALLLLFAALALPARAQRGWGGGDGGERPRSSRRRAPQPMQAAPEAYSSPAAAPPAESIVVQAPAAPAAVEPRREEIRDARPRTKRARRAPNHAPALRAIGPPAALASFESSETRPKHVYWHDNSGVRYAHYYDGKAHWYGFYDGPRFYWARYAADRWWWYDAAVSRWLYWHDGYWWWQNPAVPGSIYLDINDSLYAYAEAAPPAAAPAAASPENAAPAPAAPADAAAAVVASSAAAKGVADNRASVSPDGTRMVQIYGDRREAFLYDQTGGAEPRFLAFLASGAKRVRFSQPADGQPFDIMVVLSDGTFELFDANGNPDVQPAAAGSPPADASPAGDSGLPGPPQ